MDASRRLISFYEPLMRDLGVTWAKDLGDARGDTWVMVAGVKVASQTPAVRSGQRIIFLTLDDGTGLSDVTLFERVQPWCATTVFHGTCWRCGDACAGPARAAPASWWNASGIQGFQFYIAQAAGLRIKPQLYPYSFSELSEAP